MGHLASLTFVEATEIGIKHLAKIELTPKESTILEFISNNRDASQKEIAQQTGTKQSLLVNILDTLTARGLLVRERSIVDRRRQTVRLTEAGQGLRGRIRELQHAANEELIEKAGLSAEEEQTLVTLLRKVANKAGDA